MFDKILYPKTMLNIAIKYYCRECIGLKYISSLLRVRIILCHQPKIKKETFYFTLVLLEYH